MKNEHALSTVRKRFEEFEQGLNGGAATPRHAQRKSAIARFLERGFPTMRDEEWRYTNINAILETDFAPASVPTAETLSAIDAAGFLPGLKDMHRLVFVDGHYVEALSVPGPTVPGLAVLPLSVAIEEQPDLVQRSNTGIDDSAENPFASLNAAFAQEGAFIHAAAGTVCETPIHLLFLSTGGSAASAHPRIHILAEDHAELSIIEQHAALGEGNYFRNIVTEAVVGTETHVRVYKIQDEAEDARHVASAYARVAGRGEFQNHYFGFGSALLRNNLHTVLEDEYAECRINGVFIPHGSQHMDHHTVIDHASANCNSHELYKGILNDSARGVFSGRIIVRKDSQKTDAKQSNNNLLLSDNAQIDTKPQLEIWADDVKCTHGATIGRIDEEAMFYLRSRGVPEALAGNILSYAFASELLSHVKTPALHDYLDHAIHERLERSWKTS
ncbi:Fe-S cluster assembly protein SufD [bacterium]|nr:Fe-S cluster assembly protein SufD [bacterium]